MTEEGVFQLAADGDTAAVLDAVREWPTLAHAIGPHSTTLLHAAARHDDVELARGLMEAGADLQAQTAWGHTPFEWAANMGSSNVAALLLKAGGDQLDLWTASALGMIDFVEGCFVGDELKPGAGRSPVPGAVLDGWPEDGAFRAGAFVSDAFYIACRNGHTAVAAFLLERGADVDAIGYFGARAIHWAAMNGHTETVEWLVEQGADVEIDDPKFNGSPSGWANEGGHPELARWLEEIGG